MRHIPTFESFLNEGKGIGPKIKKVWDKYEKKGTEMEMTLGEDLKDFFDNEELDPSTEEAIKAIGKPEDVIDITTVNGGEEDFDGLLTDLKAAGLKHKEYFVDHGGPGVIVENK